MQIDNRNVPASVIGQSRTPARITGAQWIGIVSVSLFIGVQVALAAIAAIWALAGLLSLTGTGLAILALMISIPTIAAIVVSVRLAYIAETDPDNNDSHD